MKNIHLSVDGGGTSLRVLAFDDDLRLIAQSRSNSVNGNFESVEKITDNISEAARMLHANLSGEYKIENIYETIVGSADLFNKTFLKNIGNFAEVPDIFDISESRSHLLAASLGYVGGVALAGTGSGAIYCNKGTTIHLGGYGIPVGDEGSGAWIGIHGISAAIKHISGWGEETALTERLYEYLNISGANSLIGALYRKNINQRSLFAGFCRYVGECERNGDKVAGDIIYSAGRDMGLQMVSVLKRAEKKKIFDSAKETPVIYASGGAWKGSGYMLEAMRETVQKNYADAICLHGLFDPVISGVIQFIFDKINKNPKEYKDHLKKEFSEYLVEISGQTK